MSSPYYICVSNLLSSQDVELLAPFKKIPLFIAHFSCSPGFYISFTKHESTYYVVQEICEADIVFLSLMGMTFLKLQHSPFKKGMEFVRTDTILDIPSTVVQRAYEIRCTT